MPNPSNLETVTSPASSAAIELPYGDGAISVSNPTTLASVIEISLGDDVWVPDKDNTAPSASGVFTVENNAPCRVRLRVTAGNCDVQIVPQLKEKYR